MTDTTTFNETFLLYCENELGNILQDNGFIKVDKLIDEYGGQLIYRKGKQDILIYSDTHPRDYPYFFNICFVLNDDTVNHTGYSKVPLWYIKRTLAPHSNAHEYNLADKNTMGLINTSRLGFIIQAAKNDLIQYNIGFLSGDISKFVQIRQKRFDT